MEKRYLLLRTIYDIVKYNPRPTEYLLRPRELILRMMTDWTTIKEHLDELEQEKLVTTKQHDTLVITITEAGLEKLKLLAKENRIIE
jgi:DNA-binding MarR family transcriptional regulator